ncbi:MAG: LytTR family DNA-binding domain-containing protein [Steroidobacter sp.]
MRHPLATAAPRGGDHLQLLLLWAVVIGATLIYWEACRLAHGGGSINLRDSGLWMVEIWSGWLILSFPAYALCRRWRSNTGGFSVRRVLVLMATLSVLALGSEWLLNLMLSQLGIARWESAWAMFNRRALLCVVVSGAIVAFALRPGVFRRTVERPSPPLQTAATLTLTDRTGTVVVSLHEVEAILAAENYVQVCLANGKEYLHRMALARIEKDLDASTMLRVHRSAIVNINRVIRRLPGWRLELASGRTVRVGRTFRAAIEESRWK